jgi:hypothetical protein
MATMLYPNVGSLAVASAIRTFMAASKLRLIKDPGPTLAPGITLAELAAAEADYTGYLAITVANYNLAILSPLGGAQIGSGTQQFITAAPYTVGNSIVGQTIQSVVAPRYKAVPARQ